MGAVSHLAADPGNKGFYAGTHRLVSPAETLRRIGPLMARAEITRVANITGLDRVGVPVVSVIRPNARSLSVSQGKGVTLDAAKASGIMEALELYHAESIDLPLVWGSRTELRGTRELVDTAALPPARYSPFHDGYRVQWIESRSLFDNRSVWVPFECVHTDARLEQPSGSGCFSSTSNGLASGNHLLEAIGHGLCEVVERDATTLWHLLDDSDRQATRIDLDSIAEPVCRVMLDRFEKAGLGVLVWDATSDVKIPVFVCMIFERSDDPDLAIFTSNGSGCHPDKSVAISRALTEAAQSRLTLIAGSRDDLWRHMYDDRSTASAWLAKLRAESSVAAQRSFSDIGGFAASTFAEDLERELGCLRNTGIQDALFVDLSKPEFELPVVRVIVPTLEGSDEVADYVSGQRTRKLAG